MHGSPSSNPKEHTIEQNQFNDNVKAIAALLTTVLAAVAGFVGLPAYVSPELIAGIASAVTAAVSVFYLIRGNRTAPAA
jgi:hypothetical protein